MEAATPLHGPNEKLQSFRGELCTQRPESQKKLQRGESGGNNRSDNERYVPECVWGNYWLMAVEEEAFAMHEPRRPVCSVGRQTDAVNPRGARRRGLSGAPPWINVTGCSWANVYLPNLIEFLMLHTQPLQARDGLISQVKPAARSSVTAPCHGQPSGVIRKDSGNQYKWRL